MQLSLCCTVFFLLRKWSGSTAAQFTDDDIYEVGVDVENNHYMTRRWTFDEDTEVVINTRLKHRSFPWRTINRRDLQDALKHLFGARYPEITENQFTALFITTDTYYKEAETTALTLTGDDSELIGDISKTVSENDAAYIYRDVYKESVGTDQMQTLTPTLTQSHKFKRKIEHKNHKMDKKGRNKSKATQQYNKNLRASRTSWFGFRRDFDAAEEPVPNMKNDEPPAVADDPPAVADAPPAVADAPPAVADVPPAVADDPPAVADDPPAVADDPPAVADDPPAVADDPPAVADDPPAVADASPAVADAPPAVADASPAVADNPPAVADDPPAVADNPPAVADAPPAVAGDPPAVDDDSPAVASDSPAVTDDSIPVATPNDDPIVTAVSEDDATKSDDNVASDDNDDTTLVFHTESYAESITAPIALNNTDGIDITNVLESAKNYTTLSDSLLSLTTNIDYWKMMYMNEMKTRELFNISMLVDIIRNLTMSYDFFNMTQKLNETLQNMSLSVCPYLIPPETTTPTTTTEPPPGTGRVWSKCFVCGLTDHEIPNNTWCGDAFSGDFLPLVPIDATGRGHIAQFRKYCKWRNNRNIWLNESDRHSVYGRWTGGCAVRWIDLSSIYTQRTCRNKDQATMGKHFLSKRMAKLEMALKGLDNGCIISPVATLVPFSRGISLYARFHACVCTGNWCNRASIKYPWIDCVAVFMLFSLSVYLLHLS